MAVPVLVAVVLVVVTVVFPLWYGCDLSFPVVLVFVLVVLVAGAVAVAVVVSFRSVCSNADNLCLCDTKTTHFPQKRGLLTGDCATYSYT